MAVQLSTSFVTFSTKKEDTAHFFDDANRQILVVHHDSEVLVTPLDGSAELRFRVENRGNIMSLKLSLDKTVLAVQRSSRTIELVRLSDNHAFSIACRSSKMTTTIVAFHWTPENEVLLVTSVGLELFQLSPERDACKFTKSTSVNVNWQVYSPESKILAVSTGPAHNSLYFFQVKAGSINKLPKLDIPMPAGRKLPGRDVCLSILYGKIYCIYVKQIQETAAEIQLYQITRETTFKLPTIALPTGSYSLNFADNLILAHNVTTKMTSIYDIRSPTLNQPVIPPSPLPPASVTRFFDGVSKPAEATPFADGERWFVFQPDIIIAWDQGFVWTLAVSLPVFLTGKFTEHGKLLNFLLRRRNAKRLIMDFLRSLIEKPEPLSVIAGLFDQLNAVFSTAIQEKAADVAKATVRERVKKQPSFSSLLSSYLGLTTLEEANGNGSSDSPELGGDIAPTSPQPQLVIGEGASSKSPVAVAQMSTASAAVTTVAAGSATSAAASLPQPKAQLAQVKKTASRSSMVGTTSRSPVPSILSSRLASGDSLMNSFSDMDIYDTFEDDSPVEPRIPGERSSSSSSMSGGSSSSSASANDKRGGGKQAFAMLLINQQNMYTWVFYPMVENKNLHFKFKVAVLTEYIRSLNQHDLPVKHYIYELVIHLLVINQRCYQLHQFLQYHVVRDSVHVACLLLSLVPQYPPAYQLAIDMLKRLKTLDSIVEVLLLKSQVITALRFSRSNELQTSVPASTFLDTALQTGDKNLFFGVYQFFQSRNHALYGRPDFQPQDGNCEKFVKHYESLFASTTGAVLTSSASSSSLSKFSK